MAQSGKTGLLVEARTNAVARFGTLAAQAIVAVVRFSVTSLVHIQLKYALVAASALEYPALIRLLRFLRFSTIRLHHYLSFAS